jgi:transcriptional regulator with XRE-family HTH domain
MLRRRHVHAWAAIPIGKEADNLEERETIGDDDDAVQWSIANPDRQRITKDIEDILAAHQISDRTLWGRAGVSHHTLADLRKGRRVTELSLLSLAQAAEELRKEALTIATERSRWLDEIQRQVEIAGSVAKLAFRLGVSRQYLGRVLRAKKPVTDDLIDRITNINFRS